MMSDSQTQDMDSQTETERRILDAAKRVFVRKGMNGASMQEIANEANMSRPSLHYHFRSKRRLADAVLTDLFGRVLPQVQDIIFVKSGGLREKLKRFVEVYLDMFLENPYVPNFIMNEINTNPKDGIRRFQGKGLLSHRLQDQVRDALRVSTPDVEPSQFMMNLISLCIFPFIARPVVEAFFGDGRQDAFKRFITARKEIIVETMMASIERGGGDGPDGA
jgi:AcrR family transcriptional regulator